MLLEVKSCTLVQDGIAMFLMRLPLGAGGICRS